MNTTKYFRELAKRRKNPYHHFKDPENARKAQKKAVEARRKKADKEVDNLK